MKNGTIKKLAAESPIINTGLHMFESGNCSYLEALELIVIALDEQNKEQFDKLVLNARMATVSVVTVDAKTAEKFRSEYNHEFLKDPAEHKYEEPPSLCVPRTDEYKSVFQNCNCTKGFKYPDDKEGDICSNCGEPWGIPAVTPMSINDWVNSQLYGGHDELDSPFLKVYEEISKERAALKENLTAYTKGVQLGQSWLTAEKVKVLINLTPEILAASETMVVNPLDVLHASHYHTKYDWLIWVDSDEDPSCRTYSYWSVDTGWCKAYAIDADDLQKLES